MTERISLAKRWSGAALALFLLLPLLGCLDLAQRLSIDRSGAGGYEIAITANGLLGEALKNNRAAIAPKHNAAKTQVLSRGDHVTQTTAIRFKSLSDLHLSNESISLTDRGASWFGLGPSHVTFRRTVLVDRARRENIPKSGEADRFGSDLAQTMFGDHSYVFTVSVPGSVDYASPLRIGRSVSKPQIRASDLGQTVTWRLPLYTLLQAKLITFQVDFSAYGSFPDAQSLPD